MEERENIGYDAVLGGLFGALALVLPFLFHLINLGPINAGRIFLPMFLPIVALAGLANWRVSLSVAVLIPILSFLLTQMPPLMPPILPIMIVELLLISSLMTFVYQKRRINIYFSLILVAIIDRLFLFIILFLLEKKFLLISGLFSVLGVIMGIPGFALQLVVIPPLLKYLEPRISELKKLR